MTLYDDWMWEGWHASANGRARLKREVRTERVTSTFGSEASDDADTYKIIVANGKVGLRNSKGQVLEIERVTDLLISHALLTKSGDYALSDNDEQVVRKWTRFVMRVGVQFTGFNTCLNNVVNGSGPEVWADRPVPFDTSEQSVLASTIVDFMAEGCRMRVMHTTSRGRLLNDRVYFFACSRGPTGWIWDQAIPALEQASAASILCAELANDVRTLRSEVYTPVPTELTPSMFSTCRTRDGPGACYVSAEAVDSSIIFVTSCNGSCISLESCCSRILLAAGAPNACIFSSDRGSSKDLRSLSLPGYDPGSLLRMGYRKVDMSWAGSMKDYRHVGQGLIPLRMRAKERSNHVYVTGRVDLASSGVLQATPRVTVRCLRDLARAKAALQANPGLAADAFYLLPVDAEMQSWVRSNANWIERIPVPRGAGRRCLNLGVSPNSDFTAS